MHSDSWTPNGKKPGGIAIVRRRQADRHRDQNGPAGGLSGRVLDQDGDPWPHARVHAVYHSVWKKGRRHIQDANFHLRTWTTEASSASPDFRPAATTFSPNRTATGKGCTIRTSTINPQFASQPTWYPSAPDLESSRPSPLQPANNSVGSTSGCGVGTGSNLRIRGKLTGFKISPRLRAIRDWPQAVNISAPGFRRVTDEDRGHAGRDSGRRLV